MNIFIIFDIITKHYSIGHLYPGDEVFLEKDNPRDLKLRSWLNVINIWSENNPGHTPITIGFDVKDDLTDN